MKKSILVCLMAIMFGGFVFGQEVQGPNSDNKTKAIFIYGFTKYFSWPAELKKGEFKIGVLGVSEELVSELRKLASMKSVDNQSITIVTFDTYDVKLILATHILVYDANVVKGLKITDVSKNSLVVSDNQADYKNTMIGFFKDENNKIKFGYNELTTKKSNLTVNPNFKKLAATVIE